MILAIDIGNSSIKWKLWESNADCSKGVLALDADMSVLRNEMKIYDPELIIVSNVNDKLFERKVSIVFPGSKIEFLKSTKHCLGVTNAYDDPKALGIDRWIGIIEAFNISEKKNCCIFDIGTAATLDVVNSKGEHLGGQIVPGLSLARDALLRSTSNVRFNNKNSYGIGYGVNTVDGVEKGTCAQLLAWINDESSQFKAQYPNGVVYMTGGSAKFLLSKIKGDVILEEDLILNGMIRLARS